MTLAARRAPRLGRDDWIAAGQAVLCEAAIAGLRLSVLTRRLHVTTRQRVSDWRTWPGKTRDVPALARTSRRRRRATRRPSA